jgi:hypothetical protein
MKYSNNPRMINSVSTWTEPGSMPSILLNGHPATNEMNLYIRDATKDKILPIIIARDPNTEVIIIINPSVIIRAAPGMTTRFVTKE